MKPRIRARTQRAATAFLAMAAIATLAAPASATDSEGWTLYQAFVAECKTSTSMESLLPYLPEWRHKRFQKSDEEGRRKTLDRLCRATRDDYEDIALVKEEPTGGNETTLFLKATWQGSPMKGKITLVREGDELKVESWLWNTG